MSDDATPPAAERQLLPASTAAPQRWRGLRAAALGLLALLTLVALLLAWTTQRRVKSLEQELVRRQADSQTQAVEARTMAKAAQDVAREAAAKSALLEARVAETSMQRSQVEELIQSFSRSRDENVIADVEAAVRVALQQNAITGSAEPLVATLKQADERLARYNQPRLERVRRAVLRDLDRVKAIGAIDVSTLTIRLDEAVRQVDELPLLALAEARRPALDARGAAGTAPRAASASAAASVASASASDDWQRRAGRWWEAVTAQVWTEVRSLVRVTRIDHPEAALLAPEQAFFVRENLKLRLLNARLALLSRQFDIAQSDLREAQSTLDRYFDRSSKRVTTASELLRQVMTQARQTSVPRPDETLAALAAAAAGR